MSTGETALREATNAALEAMRAHPRHVLPMQHRLRVWRAFGPPGPLTSQGHTARALVAIAAAEKVLPVWKQYWPDDKRPEKAIDLAHALVRRTTDRDDPAVDDVMSDVFGATEEHSVPYEHFVAARAAESALRALDVILLNEETSFAVSDRFTEQTDDELSEGDDHAVALACYAWSGGNADYPSSNPAKRREFWEWYLGTATHDALRAATTTIAP